MSKEIWRNMWTLPKALKRCIKKSVAVTFNFTAPNVETCKLGDITKYAFGSSTFHVSKRITKHGLAARTLVNFRISSKTFMWAEVEKEKWVILNNVEWRWSQRPRATQHSLHGPWNALPVSHEAINRISTASLEKFPFQRFNYSH